MGQVPDYVIIGDGRVARHFCHYFSLLGIAYQQWSRAQSEQTLHSLVSQHQRLLLLISDNAIETFINEHPELQNKLLIHFSGSLVTDLAIGVHPLMTFATQHYDLDTYKQLPFILEEGNYSFNELMPGLPNSHYILEKSKKPLYHSLCVLSGNFTSLLWQKCFDSFEKELGLPPEVTHLYLDRIVSNLKQNPEQALTGPLQRGDTKTITNNLKALEGDKYQAIYKAFVNATVGCVPRTIKTQKETS